MKNNAFLIVIFIIDLPLIKDLQVTTGKHCINLLCSYEVLGRSPKVSRIAWSKNGEILDERVISFAESIISESCYKITPPSNEDKGKYSCTITNAVGSVSEEITLGNVNLLRYFIFVPVNILSMLYLFKKPN